jgi:hypothetical protein
VPPPDVPPPEVPPEPDDPPPACCLRWACWSEHVPALWRSMAAFSAARKSGLASSKALEIERSARLSAFRVWSQSSMKPSRSKSR